jgi:outer membrane receptor protein involved in Fe transport
LDYFINDFNTLSFTGAYHVRGFEISDLYQYNDFDYNHLLTDYYERYAEGKNESGGWEAIVNYKKTFEQKGREWTIDASFEKDDHSSGQDMRSQDYTLNMEWESPATFQQSSTVNDNYEAQFRTDYVHPIGKGRLETGYKFDYESNDQDYILSNLDAGGTVWITDTNTSNRFIYKEQIHAAYLIYSNSIKKFQYQAGVRFEEDLSNADQATQDIQFNRDRFSFFPSVHLKYEFSEMHALQLSYSRRIHRPNVRNLNPFTNYSDPLYLSTGNPYLKPEYIDAAELGYDFSYQGTNITTSIFYRQINDVITRITLLDSLGISRTTYENLNNGRSYGVELIYAQKLFKWWKFNASGSYFRQEYEGDQVLQGAESNYSWNAKLNSVWSPMKGFDIQASFIYNAPSLSTTGSTERFFSGGSQGKMEENYWADFGMKKDFLKGSLSLSFRISDVFKTQKFNMYSWGENFSTYTERVRDSRIFFLGISYKLNGGVKKKRTDDSNFDIEDF